MSGTSGDIIGGVTRTALPPPAAMSGQIDQFTVVSLLALSPGCVPALGTAASPPRTGLRVRPPP